MSETKKVWRKESSLEQQGDDVESGEDDEVEILETPIKVIDIFTISDSEDDEEICDEGYATASTSTSCTQDKSINRVTPTPEGPEDLFYNSFCNPLLGIQTFICC